MNHETIVIAGSGRSGTTWVQDSIAEANNLRTIFEPLNPAGVPAAQEFAYRFVDPDTDDPALAGFMDQVFSGGYRSLWMNYRMSPSRFNVLREGLPNTIHAAGKMYRHYKKYKTNKSQARIVKFIRANLMLPWLVRRYELPLLFVTRHPCAVLASRLQLGGEDWTSQLSLDRYRQDPCVAQLVMNQYGVDLARPFSPVASLTAVWCIENLFAINWSAQAGYMVTAYESLLGSPDSEWQRVVDGLGLQQLPGKSLLQSPSQQVSSEMQGKTFSKDHVSKWKSALTDDQLGEVATVLTMFGCSVYSVDSDFPDFGNLV